MGLMRCAIDHARLAAPTLEEITFATYLRCCKYWRSVPEHVHSLCVPDLIFLSLLFPAFRVLPRPLSPGLDQVWRAIDTMLLD